MKTSIARSRIVRASKVSLLSGLALAILLTAGPAGSGQAAPARQGLSDVVPFLGVFVGMAHRNRVYRNAEDFIAERNRYYDALRDTARRQLIEREIGGLRTSQVAAYTKLVAMIEQSRSTELAVAESLKRETRQAFHKRLESVLLQRILGTSAVQRVFGALTRGIDTSQGLLDTALDKLSGGGGGILAEIERVKTIARDVENLASLIGGPTGNRLRQAAGRVASGIERPQELIRADLEQVKKEIGELGQTVDTLARAGRTPSAGAVAERLVLRPPGGSDDPAVEAVAVLLSRLAVGNGNLRDRAKGAIQAGFVARCVAIANAFRQSVARLEGREVTAAEAVTPCHAIDLGQLAQAPEATAEGTDEAPDEPTAITPSGEQPLPEERCSLTGEGDFVIENLTASSTSSCEDSEYPFGMPAEPLLLYLATAGRWTIVSESEAGTTWAWQATSDTQGAVIDGTAELSGSTLGIDVTLSVPPSGSSFRPLPPNGNGLALAALVPLFPLAWKLGSRKRRRLGMLAITLLAFLLMAQSCEVYGSFTGHYTFPIPENGFACEVASDNPNLAEMPGSRGEVEMQLTVADDKSVDTCAISASLSGLGVLKRDGFYTEAVFDEP